MLEQSGVQLGMMVLVLTGQVEAWHWQVEKSPLEIMLWIRVGVGWIVGADVRDNVCPIPLVTISANIVIDKKYISCFIPI